MRSNLRLVHSSEDAPMTRRRAKPRVYPQAITCFSCRERFTGDDVRDVVENDGACNPCAERLDSYPLRSGQNNRDNSDHEWRGSKC